MPPKNRKQAKGTTVAAPISAKSRPPSPWSTPNPVLKPFLDSLNPAHIWITHIDRNQWKMKRNIFIVPVLMNIAVAILLIWRVKYIAPYYGALLLTFTGRPTPLSIDTKNASWYQLLDAVFNRAGTLFLDFVIFRFLTPWPIDFFVGGNSPWYWRRKLGFNDVEIVVRKSRRWDKDLPKAWYAQQEDGPGAEIFQQRIMPGIDKQFVRNKTGYLMMDKNWDLDFESMCYAHDLVRWEKNSMQDFEKTVFAYTEEHGWLVWPVWKLDEGVDEERRQKIVLFKDKLTKMGRENLFFRWIEIVQFESSQPEGFTPERQKAAMQKARELFESQGVDFEQFWDEVGGVQGMPGF